MSMLAILAQAAPEEVTLTPAGAAVMTTCVLLVVGLNVFCLLRILRPAPPTELPHAFQEIDTRDRDT